MRPIFVVLPNPTLPAGKITDRAKRYRANAAHHGPRICGYCGAKPKRLDVDHIDGRESNNNPANLIYSCRSCNTSKGATFQRHGLGTRTRQYNPIPDKDLTPKERGAKRGARTLGQWARAAMIVTGQIEADREDLNWAKILIHSTPQSRRHQFAEQLADKRRESSAARAGEVPF